MYYVMSDMGVEAEFNNFEDADNYIDENGDPSMLWVCYDDEGYEPDYDECGYDPYMGCYSYDC